MAVNRGKQFEGIVKDAFLKVPEVSVDRLHDQTTGFAGSSNICDFIIYKCPTEIYLECKSCHGGTWNLSNLTDKQFNGMLDKVQTFGVVAGVMIWWIDKDVTRFIPIKTIAEMKQTDAKSIKYTTEEGILIPGVKKRVFFDYDMSVMF